MERKPDESLADWAKRLRDDQVETMRKRAGLRDWPEDFGMENGAYLNLCLECRETFTGHKRRVVCRLCAVAVGG